MQNYLSPNDERFIGESDSKSIQNAIDEAEKGPVKTVCIPRVCARTGAEEWIIDKSILLPSNITIILDDCHLTLKEGVYENIFRNKNMYTDVSLKLEGRQRGIRIIGRGEAILDGGELIADGREGLNSLSISNAAYLSTWTNDWAEIPTAEELFEKHLNELRENESCSKK